MNKVPEIFREACRRGVFIQGEVDPDCWHLAPRAQCKGKLRTDKKAGEFEIRWFLVSTGETRCRYKWTSHEVDRRCLADDIEIVFSADIFRGNSPPAGGGRVAFMYKVYALYNAKVRRIYIGQTVNIELRLRAHNLHLLPRTYTSRYPGVWQVIYSETCTTREEALKREKQLKSYRGREFVKKYIPG